MILTIVLFLLVFSLIVFAHELGHFLSARLLGVRVDEFGIGLPPRLWKIRRGETLYSINLIPLGGYVKLGEALKPHDQRALVNQKAPVKMVLALSGAVMNLVLAFFVLLVGFGFGLPPLVSPIEKLPFVSSFEKKVAVVAVQKDSPAERAGFRQGDFLLAIDGQAVREGEEASRLTAARPNQKLNFQLERQGVQLNLVATPRLVEDKSSVGLVLSDSLAKVRYKLGAVPYLAFLESGRVTQLVVVGFFRFFAGLFTQGKVLVDFSGPVGIAKLTGEAAGLGWGPFSHFLILLTVNLGVLNVIPFPALDGGRFVLALGEFLTRRRLKPATENLIHFVGFIVLISLILLVTYRDIVKLIL